MKSYVGAVLVALSLAGVCAAGPDPAAEGPEQWIGRLAADEFSDREQAAEKLGEWAKEHPGQALERFFDESVNNAEPEARDRCRMLVRELVLDEFRREGQGYVGIQMGQNDVPLEGGEGFGIRVSIVVKDTPAEKAGMKAGDVIVELDGKRWKQPGATEAFQKQVMEHKPGDEVRMRVMRPREDKLVELKVKLARRPPISNRLMIWPMGNPGALPDVGELQRREEEEYFKKWYADRLEKSRDGKP